MFHLYISLSLSVNLLILGTESITPDTQNALYCAKVSYFISKLSVDAA